MSVDVLLGLQWGDEGKGKIVDVLTPEYRVVARFQGGRMQVTRHLRHKTCLAYHSFRDSEKQ
jgi:hypothetical protein